MSFLLQSWLSFFWCSLPLYLTAAFLEIFFYFKPRPWGQKLALTCGWLAFICHSAFLALRTIASRQAPLFGLFPSLNFFIWSLGLFYFTCSLRWGLRRIGLFMLPMISWLLLFASKAPFKGISPMPAVLKTIWFEIHVGSAFLSYALFTAGGCAALLYLLASRKQKPLSALLELCDDFTYRTSAWGVSLFSLSMVSGGIWAFLAWSDYWIWTPKELWSSIIWVYYYVYLHARITRSWQGERAQWMAFIGTLIVLFTYLGVGLLMKSSHPL